MSNILCNLTEVPTDIKIMKVRENTQLPRKANDTDACYDCYAAEMEETDTHVTYNLGFALEIPEGWCAFLFPRSSVMKYGLSLSNCVGVVDSGYRGEVKAVFTKLGFGDRYNVNDRVCQIMFHRLPSTQLVLVNSLDEKNDRGGGFGSTDSAKFSKLHARWTPEVGAIDFTDEYKNAEPELTALILKLQNEKNSST